MRWSPGGEILIAAARARDLMLYTVSSKGTVNAQLIAPNAAQPALEALADGSRHLAYVDPIQKSLMYATDASGDWTTETVDEGIGRKGGRPTLAADASGQLFVAYYAANGNHRDLRLARLAKSWAIETVQTDLDPDGGNVSLALDAAGLPRIAYRGVEDVRYAAYNGVSWSVVIVHAAGEAGGECSLALDGDGKAHVGFNRAYWWTQYYEFPHLVSGLYYATNAAGAWRTAAVIALGQYVDEGWRNTLRVDGDGHATLSFTGGYGPLELASNASGDWTFETVDNDVGVDGFSAQLADADGHTHLAYFRSADGNLALADDAAGVWSIAVVDDTGKAGISALTVDAAGHAHVSHAAPDGSLSYLTNQTGDWTIEPVTGGIGGSVRRPIVVDSGGFVHIACLQEGIGGLWLMTNAPGEWDAELIDDAGDYADLAIDGDDRLHLSYYRSSDETAMYATSASGDWEAMNLGEADAGATAIALGPDDAVHVAVDRGLFVEIAVIEAGMVRRLAPPAAKPIVWNYRVADLAVDPQGYCHLAQWASGGDQYGYVFSTQEYYTDHYSLPGVSLGGLVDRDDALPPYVAADRHGYGHVLYADMWTHALEYGTNLSGVSANALLDDAGAAFEAHAITTGPAGLHATYWGDYTLYYATFPRGWAGR
jgi:hypothetical protein